jgi:hypothetical protein
LDSRPVVVGVATFRRPTELARLLESLRALDFDSGRLRVVVVDNDPEASARSVADAARAASPFELDYEIEPVPGVAAARNRVVEMSRGAEVLAFIDDDEAADPHWLKELVAVQHRFDADLVAGPVLPELCPTAPSWLVAGRFFDGPRRPTGSPFLLTSTANLLIRLPTTTARLGELFDQRFGLTGGEDSHLCLRAHEAGLKMVWADSAFTTEFIPPSRANVSWLLMRRYSSATTLTLCEVAVAPSTTLRLAARANRLARGAARVLVSLGALVQSGIRLRRVGVLRALLGLSTGTGSVAGAVGLQYMRYRRPRTAREKYDSVG